jgi:hypothetical protein
VARHALAFLLALSACTASHRPEPPSLPGTWVFDSTRITELYEVSTTPEGPERDRALARAHVHHGQLRVEFTAEEATLVNGAHRRSLPYRVRAWHGPVVQVEGLQGDRVVVSTLKIDHDRLTWFDRDGEIELVLRRDAP